MQTFNALYNRCLDLGPRDRSVATSPINYSTLFKALVNETHGLVLNSYPWPFLETTKDLTTTVDINYIELPADIRNNQLTNVEYRVSSTEIYVPKPVYNHDYWTYLMSLGTSSSDSCQFYYVYDERIYLYPTPATSSLTVRIRARKEAQEMTQDDYTTGGILTATNGSAAIVGDTTPTVWTSGMAGNYLKITKAAATLKGDGRWYEIASVTNGTNLTLAKNYAGTSIAAGAAAYTIGELPLIPGAFQNLLVYRPLAIYFMATSPAQSDRYWRLYDGGHEAGLAPRVGGLLKNMTERFSGTTEGIFMEEQQPRDRRIEDVSIPNTIDGGAWT